ncbi:MAG: GTP-binding protein [Promethearchaeota archaeon]|nr:MAG: GTP-binding protein [Candidatus Lokiarchaeota archaeon]
MKYNASFKICIFGEAGVGKTSLTYRYISNRFKDDTKLTLGVDIVAHDIVLGSNRIKLQIWDFGGEERFRVFLPAYVRGSSGAIFMYDITRKNTLDNIAEWLSVFKNNVEDEEENIPILCVGGKTDLEEEREVDVEDVKPLIQKYDLYGVTECSAKTGENVQKIFESISYEILKNIGLV